MSRITLIAYGTRGDAQPAIALGKGLQAAGHRVRIVASSHFRSWIEGHGLEAAPASVDITALMATAKGREWAERGTNPIAQITVMRQLLRRHGLAIANDAYAACVDADLIVSQFTSVVFATSIVEKLGTAHLTLFLQPPFFATREGRALFSAPLPGRSSWVNYLFGKLVIQQASWMIYGEAANHFRHQTLGLPRQSRADSIAAVQATPHILAFSRHVVPPAADWPPTVQTTGYLFLDEGADWQPPPPLLDFLADGAPPVAIGFGSMTGEIGQRISRLIAEAVPASGARAVLLAGWGGLGDIELPSSILRLDAVPHDWLFPRMAALVHHGGAGTTAAGLRAGIPMVIVPHMADQPFWGQRVAALGVGPTPIPRPRLTAPRLAQAIYRATTDLEMKRRVDALAAQIHTEDGVTRAVEIIAQRLHQHAPQP